LPLWHYYAWKRNGRLAVMDLFQENLICSLHGCRQPAFRRVDQVMSNVQCFTSATFSYIDRVRVLGKTLHQHHPDWNLTLCLCDKEPPGFQFDLAKEPIDDLVRIDDLGIPNFKQWIFMHDVIELCTAVKGPMLCRLLNAGASKVIYMDPDIAIVNSLNEIEELLDRYEIVLTPHQLSPDDGKQAIIDNEIGSLIHGIYNLGFLAVANQPEGRRFSEWWQSRLMEFCYSDPANGLFTDQRWCDHVPAMFSNVCILRDPGYNVASWNLSRRLITIEQDGSIRANGSLLRFFHFTKISAEGATMLERYGGFNINVYELAKWYNDLLAENAAPGVPKDWWTFGHYADGSPIDKKERIAYCKRADLLRTFPDPFASEPQTLAAFINIAREVVYSSKHKSQIVDQPIADIDQDSLFMEIFEAARLFTMTPKERIYALYCACRHVLETDIPGDFVECGVWMGGSSIAAALTFERIAAGSHGRRFFLYDTYEGMANPTDKDIDLYGIHARKYLEKYSDNGKWAYCDIEEVRKNFEKAGVRNTELLFIKGCVEDTIPDQSPLSISILRLDTDWYQSTMHELKHLWPRLSERGFCIVDDYGYWRGAQLAVDEYFARKGKAFMHRIDQESRLIIKQQRVNLLR
jgi:hypothetical protein